MAVVAVLLPFHAVLLPFHAVHLLAPFQYYCSVLRAVARIVRPAPSAIAVVDLGAVVLAGGAAAEVAREAPLLP